MKSDTERKKFHTEKMHKRKSRLHVHLSKDLRAKIKKKKRSLLVRKGDSVKIMRGPHKGKEAKVSDVNVLRRVVFLEGVAVKNARGREMPLPLQPSNLLLVGLESTKERKEIFSDEAFKKKESPKPKEAKESKPDGHDVAKAGEAKAEHKPAEHKHEHTPEHKAEHKPEHKAEHSHKPEHKGHEAKEHKHAK